MANDDLFDKAARNAEAHSLKEAASESPTPTRTFTKEHSFRGDDDLAKELQKIKESLGLRYNYDNLPLPALRIALKLLIYGLMKQELKRILGLAAK